MLVPSLVLLLALAVAEPDPMELNRSGRWAEAAEAAKGRLANADLDPLARCEAAYGLVYAELRLGRRDSAITSLADYDEACSKRAAGTWIEREMGRLRAELEPPTPAMDDDWPVASDPGALGLDAAALEQHQQLCEKSGATACLVVHRAQIVQEFYGPGYHEPMMAMSSTKSVTGLLAGMLIHDQRLALDDPVARHLPEWKAGVEAGVTVRHLLTMTAGLRNLSRGGVGSQTDKESFVFRLAPENPPGTAWDYTNEGVFLLSPLLDRAAGEPIETYAARELFQPLGMQRTRFRVYPRGQAWTHADLETTPRDLARLGQLMLQCGRWKGHQVVPARWVEESVRPSQELNPRYGLLWWLDVPEGFAARGFLDTNIYVLPEQDLVVVRMQNSASKRGMVRYEPSAFKLFERLAPRRGEAEVGHKGQASESLRTPRSGVLRCSDG